MKQKLTKLLAVILSTSMLCAIPVFAADETSEPRITFQSHDSSTKNFSANNITFQLSTTLYDADSQYKAGVWIVVPNQQVVPAQTMSATAYLFDGNKNMVRSHSTTQTNDTYFIYTETLKDDSSTPVFYAYGDVTIDYLDDSSTASSKTPILYYNDGILQEYSSMPKSVSGNEPTKTAQGLVYGNIVDNRMSDLDLIAAVGVDGTCGYVLRTDFAPELDTQEERESRMAALKENNLIPLYNLNGKQIGQFAIDVEDDISEEIQARLDQMQLNLPVSADNEPKRTAQGLVYGNILDNSVSDLDLIAARGVDGTYGYVLKKDFAPELTTTEARIARMAALKENNLIPLYDLDGNQIGQFAIDVEDDDDDIREDIQARIDQMQLKPSVSANSEAASTPEPQGESIASAISEEVNSRMVNGTYPTTANGETYGTLMDSFVIGYYPDLIAVVGNANRHGYIYYRELQRASAGALVNVYDLNGNVIDHYGQG